ncbi:two-component system response regulator [Vibrio agarivorans]|uniref:two-component system response regulator n=1 Tax=Vibrio agarivorans TaxID=153622 RepID=UPI0025B453A6|nr:EAL domain-containing response regulator [Vibrio agarivorans]MDN3662979.1 EAL domain-containing response regulator [Vibrio agarivorans]
MNSVYQNILIIEDERLQRRLLQRALESLTDAKIHIAENGLEGLELATQFNPDLIFCDLKMPNMDGVQFAQQLVNLSIDTKLVFISSTDSDILNAVVHMASNQGLKHCTKLNKPISKQDIVRVLQQLEQVNVVSHNKDIPTALILEEDELQLALINKEISPFYQPQFDAKSGGIVGIEALARWHHPTEGILTPDRFLPAISEFGLNYLLCSTMLRQSFSQLKQWHNKGFSVAMSVNAAPSDLMQANFADRVVGLLEEFSLPGHFITLEVTETEVASNLNLLIEHTSRLRLSGVNISIDDFGIGYSSLAQLLSSPFNELKIDRFFINEMLTSNSHMATIEFIVSLAKKLGLTVVAEGVESKQQALALQQMGCDVLQGFLFSKPIPGEQLEALLTKNFAPHL